MDWIGQLLGGLFKAISNWGSGKAEVPRDEIAAERERVDAELEEKHADAESDSSSE